MREDSKSEIERAHVGIREVYWEFSLQRLGRLYQREVFSRGGRDGTIEEILDGIDTALKRDLRLVSAVREHVRARREETQK